MDPSLTAFGYAVVRDDSGLEILEHGCIKTSKTGGRASESDTARVFALASALKDVVDRHKPDEAVFEVPVGAQSFNAARALAAARAVSVTLCAAHGLRFHIVEPKHAKKILTGDPGADKEVLYMEVLKEFPAFANPDERLTKEARLAASDALAVFLAWRNTRDRGVVPEEPWEATKYSTPKTPARRSKRASTR